MIGEKDMNGFKKINKKRIIVLLSIFVVALFFGTTMASAVEPTFLTAKEKEEEQKEKLSFEKIIPEIIKEEIAKKEETKIKDIATALSEEEKEDELKKESEIIDDKEKTELIDVLTREINDKVEKESSSDTISNQNTNNEDSLDLYLDLDGDGIQEKLQITVPDKKYIPALKELLNKVLGSEEDECLLCQITDNVESITAIIDTLTEEQYSKMIDTNIEIELIKHNNIKSGSSKFMSNSDSYEHWINVANSEEDSDLSILYQQIGEFESLTGTSMNYGTSDFSDTDTDYDWGNCLEIVIAALYFVSVSFFTVMDEIIEKTINILKNTEEFIDQIRQTDIYQAIVQAAETIGNIWRDLDGSSIKNFWNNNLNLFQIALPSKMYSKIDGFINSEDGTFEQSVRLWKNIFVSLFTGISTYRVGQKLNALSYVLISAVEGVLLWASSLGVLTLSALSTLISATPSIILAALGATAVVGMLLIIKNTIFSKTWWQQVIHICCNSSNNIINGGSSSAFYFQQSSTSSMTTTNMNSESSSQSSSQSSSSSSSSQSSSQNNNQENTEEDQSAPDNIPPENNQNDDNSETETNDNSPAYLKIEVEDTSVIVGDLIKVTVLDNDDNPVKDATVKFGLETKGKTNNNGEIEFSAKLKNMPWKNVKASKSGYINAENVKVYVSVF